MSVIFSSFMNISPEAATDVHADVLENRYS